MVNMISLYLYILYEVILIVGNGVELGGHTWDVLSECRQLYIDSASSVITVSLCTILYCRMQFHPYIHPSILQLLNVLDPFPLLGVFPKPLLPPAYGCCLMVLLSIET